MMAKQTKFPISVRLFFESGDPSGICESYMDNFNGIVHRVPRAFINAKSLVNDKLIEDVSLSSSSFAQDSSLDIQEVVMKYGYPQMVLN